MNLPIPDRGYAAVCLETCLTPPTLLERRFFANDPFEMLPRPCLSLTCPRIPPNIRRLHDWPNHLSLPHRRETRWWRDGCRVQGRGHPAASLRRPEVPAR